MNTNENNTPEPAPTPASAFAPALASINAIAEIFSSIVGKIVSLATQALSPALIRQSCDGARVIGNYAVLASIVFTFINALIYAVRFRTIYIFLAGVGIMIALVIAHYAAGRFLAASDKIISGTPGRISSTAFPDCVGLLLLLLAIGVFVGGIIEGKQESSIVPFILAIVIALLLVLTAAITLNPKSVGIEIGNASAGEEAIGLISFFLKTCLKLVSAQFCLLALAGCVLTIWGFFSPDMGANASGFFRLLPFASVLSVVPPSMIGPGIVLYACLTPIFTYLFFLFGSLMLDLARAILVLPEKLDSTRR